MASPDTEIVPDVHPLCIVYKSGRIEPKEPKGCLDVPPGLDPVTGVDSKDVVIDSDNNIQARLYCHQLHRQNQNQQKKINGDNKNVKKLPILLFFHGGAFFMEIYNAFSSPFHELLNAISSEVGVLAVSVNYRLAQQARLPAAYDDAWTSLKWVFSGSDSWIAEHGDLERVFVAGDSAGANITHNLAMKLGTEPEQEGMKIQGVALLCPFFWGKELIGEETFSDAIVFGVAWALVLTPGMTLDHPCVNPLAEGAPSLAELGSQKALVITGGTDSLRWRGKAYAEALTRSNGWGEEKVEFKEYEGKGHDFYIGKLETEEGKDVLRRLAAFINLVN